MNPPLRCSILVILFFLAFAHPSPAEPLLKNGDRHVFFGDSITEYGGYTVYVADHFALRYPKAKITFRNAGWHSDNASSALARMQRDVLNLKPTVVSLCFGMNDGGQAAFNPAVYEAYLNNMSNMVAQLRAAQVKVVLLTPGCIDPDQNPRLKACNYNETLARFAAGLKALAARENIPIFDIHALMLDVQTRAKLEDPAFTMLPDGIHPTARGGALMAYGLLQALGATESASSLVVDVAKASAKPDRCVVTNLHVTPNSVRFTRIDAALPTYWDPEVSSIYKFCSKLEDLNRYDFKVIDLPAGTWKLTVSGIEVGQFNADQLVRGVNLATLPGPWQAFAGKIHAAAGEERHLYHIRWRSIQTLGLPAEARPEQDALLAKLDELIANKETIRREFTAKDQPSDWALDLVL